MMESTHGGVYTMESTHGGVYTWWSSIHTAEHTHTLCEIYTRWSSIYMMEYTHGRVVYIRE